MSTSYANDYVVTKDNLDVEFDFKEGKAGRMIEFRSSDIESCSISLAKEDFKPGFTETVGLLGEGNFDLTCMTSDGYFSLSPIVDTSAQLQIIDKDGIIIYLDFNLYNPRAKTWLKRERIQLQLGSKNK